MVCGDERFIMHQTNGTSFPYFFPSGLEVYILLVFSFLFFFNFELLSSVGMNCLLSRCWN